MTTAAAGTADLHKSLSVEIAGEIRALLGRQERSRRQLALALGKEPSWLTKRLTGVIPLSVPELEVIAAELGTTAIEILLATPSARSAGATNGGYLCGGDEIPQVTRLPRGGPPDMGGYPSPGAVLGRMEQVCAAA